MARHHDSAVPNLVVEDTQSLVNVVEWLSLLGDSMPPIRSLEEFRDRLPDFATSEVTKIVDLMKGQDAYDIIELMRMREIPMVLDGYTESSSSNLASLIDIVTLIVIGVGKRRPPADTDVTITPDGMIEDITDSARNIAMVAQLLGAADTHADDAGPIDLLAGLLRTHELMVRNKHYESIADELNHGVLSEPKVQRLLTSTIGFDYDDLIEINGAIKDMYSGKKFATRSGLSDLIKLYKNGGMSEDDQAQAQRLLSDTMIAPGKSSSFRGEGVATFACREVRQVDAVMSLFGIKLGDGSAGAVELVTEFVNGHNPLAGIGFIDDGEGNHLMLQGGIPSDLVRRTIESRLKGTSAWDAYTKHRDKAFAETFACSKVAAMLGVGRATYPGLKYFAPASGRGTADLTKDAAEPARYGRVVEADALYIVDGVAICLEVKAGSLRDDSRSGDVNRLASDLKKILTEAAEQSSRLAQLIIRNGGLWSKDRKWIDLTHVQEVHTIVACLDDFGPLGIAADNLVRAGVLTDDTIPWIVSLHDLAVIELLLDEPAAFLLYLRRRTQATAAKLVIAVDELDVLMWYLRGGLFFEEDPVTLHRMHPTSRKPSNNDKYRFRKQLPTHVSTLTDDLDAWMYFREGRSSIPAEKPARRHHRAITHLTKSLRARQDVGWLRTGADLLGLSGDTHTYICDTLATMCTATRGDRQLHTFAYEIVSPWAFHVVIVATQPTGKPSELAQLTQYVRAKRQQLHADRGHGILLDDNGAILDSIFITNTEAADIQVDPLLMARLRPREPDKRGSGRPTGKGRRNRKR